MIISAENYYSVEANREYMGVSQYKDFCGTFGRPGCEEQALAKMNGMWDMEKTTALLVGSYVDAHFEGTLDVFKAHNPEIFTRSKDLKAEYKKAEEIINRVEVDELFMQFMSGEKQRIFTCEMFGAPWKVKLDSYLPHIAIVDLKVMKSLREANYVRDFGHMEFVRYWGYDIQAAVYQEVVYRCTGERLPFFIAAVSKEKEPDLEVIQIPQSWMDDRIAEVEQNTPKIQMLKSGEIEPIRCGLCDYCKHIKVLENPIFPDELLGAV